MEYIGQKVWSSELKETDNTDRKLLYLLSLNSRLNATDLAKSINISSDTVKYRLNNLLKNGLITGFTIAFNRRKVGYEAVDIYFKMPKITEDLVNSLIKNQDIFWVATAQGSYNLCISTNCASLKHVQEVVSQIRSTAVNVEKMLYLPLYYEHGVPHEYLMDGIAKKPVLRSYAKNENCFHNEFLNRKQDYLGSYKLSDTEKTILDILMRNSRATLQEISLHTHKSLNTIKKIIGNLIENHILIQFETKISTKLMGYYWDFFS